MARLKSGEKGFYGKCWCGAKRGWFSISFVDRSCGGLGVLDCHCGGDLCICHNHGEIDCGGCSDCEPDDEYEYDEEF